MLRGFISPNDLLQAPSVNNREARDRHKDQAEKHLVDSVDVVDGIVVIVTIIVTITVTSSIAVRPSRGENGHIKYDIQSDEKARNVFLL